MINKARDNQDTRSARKCLGQHDAAISETGLHFPAGPQTPRPSPQPRRICLQRRQQRSATFATRSKNEQKQLGGVRGRPTVRISLPVVRLPCIGQVTLTSPSVFPPQQESKIVQTQSACARKYVRRFRNVSKQTCRHSPALL